MSRPPFIYTSLPIGHIRLLGLSSSSQNDTGTDLEGSVLSYRLATFPIEDCPSYEAISYCWGIEAASELCWLNDRDGTNGVLQITPHLKSGLRNAFDVLKSQWLWVDAICITQSDEVEKAEQVAQMGQLFANAKRVIIWLGDDYEDSERVMRTMPLLSSQAVLEVLSAQNCIDFEALSKMGVPPVEDVLWISLFDLLHRPWFERLWIVQEAVLAREAVFLCGTQTTSWNEMREICAAMRDGDLIRELGVRSALWRAERPKFRTFRALDVIESVDDIKMLRPKRPWVAALVLLAMIRKQKSNEPLDYVYGILGLLPDSCRARVFVDYSDTSRKFYGRTYAQLFQALLEGVGDAALMFLNNIEWPRGAPSWCPELRSRTQPGYSSFRITDIGAGCNPSQNGFQTPNICSFRSEADTMISVRGCIADTVVKVVSLVRPGKLWSWPLQYNDEDIVNTCVSLHQCAFAAKQLKIPRAALARTLTGQTTRSKSEEERYANALDQTRRAFSSLSELARPLKSSDLEPLLSDPSVLVYTKLLWSHWNGRSFFTTSGGRIGLGLRTMKPGDSICIFFGAPKPYMMRRTPTRKDSQSNVLPEGQMTYKLIAECFVDGIMNGELFENIDFEMEATTFFID